MLNFKKIVFDNSAGGETSGDFDWGSTLGN